MVKFLLIPNCPGAFSLIRMACGTSFTVIVPDSLSTWTFIFCAKPAVLANTNRAVSSSFFIVVSYMNSVDSFFLSNVLLMSVVVIALACFKAVGPCGFEDKHGTARGRQLWNFCLLGTPKCFSTEGI